MNFPNMQLTDAGINAIADAVYSGTEISFTRVKFGSGTAPADISSMTDLVHAVLSIGFSGCTVDGNMAKLSFHLGNAGLSSGFFMREIGIFATKNSGQEFLYSYANAGDNAAYLKPYAGDSVISLDVTAAVAIGNAENVTAVISGAVGYATTEELQNHVQDYTNPHRVTKEQLELENVVNKAPNDMTITFASITTLQDVASGENLSNIVKKIASAIKFLKSHLSDVDNPHNVDYWQTGAAAAVHTHKAAEITSGTLPVARGGTGVNTTAKLKNLVRRSVTYSTGTLAAQNWTSSGTYDLERSGYNVEIGLAPSANAAQLLAYRKACIVGSHNSNVVTALGTIPSIDIPIIIKAVEA